METAENLVKLWRGLVRITRLEGTLKYPKELLAGVLGVTYDELDRARQQLKERENFGLSPITEFTTNMTYYGYTFQPRSGSTPYKATRDEVAESERLVEELDILVKVFLEEEYERWVANYTSILQNSPLNNRRECAKAKKMALEYALSLANTFTVMAYTGHAKHFWSNTLTNLGDKRSVSEEFGARLFSALGTVSKQLGLKEIMTSKTKQPKTKQPKTKQQAVASNSQPIVLSINRDVAAERYRAWCDTRPYVPADNALAIFMGVPEAWIRGFREQLIAEGYTFDPIKVRRDFLKNESIMTYEIIVPVKWTDEDEAELARLDQIKAQTSAQVNALLAKRRNAGLK